MVKATPRLALAAAVALVCAVALFAVRSCGDDDAARHKGLTVPATAPDSPKVPDAFAWADDREKDFLKRAARGVAHALYVRSPGGVSATARRVERYRAPIEDAAKRAGVDADLVEGMIFLESAGIPDAIAGGKDTAGAVGLAQIVAETGRTAK